MLQFTITPAMKGKILFEQTDRLQFDKLRSYFKTQNKAAMFAKQYSYATSPYTYAISPLGAYNIGQTKQFVQHCQKIGILTKISDNLKSVIFPELYIQSIEAVPNKQFIYRDYQVKLLQALCNNGRGVIVSPTRSGKSLILAGLCHNIFLNSQKNDIHNIMIIVPNLQLVQQFVQDLHNYYKTGNDLPFWNIINFSAQQTKRNKKLKKDFQFKKHNIIITNAQWLLLHGDQLPYIDCIIQDEVHGITKGAQISKFVKGVKIPYKFGCTGTLPKKIQDKWNIAGIFGPVLDEIQIQELQEKNVLADVDITPIKFIHTNKQSFKHIKTEEDTVSDVFKQAQEQYKRQAMYLAQYEPTNTVITNLAKNIIKQHNDWNVLILFDYISAGQSLFSILDFQNKHYIDGSVDIQTRKDIVEAMNNPSGGQITIANFKVIGTGITIKHIQSIILVTSQSSVTKVIQAIGRGLRIQDKPILHIFDIFHNYKYSEKHFKERLLLYKQFYNKQLNKDYKVKQLVI